MLVTVYKSLDKKSSLFGVKGSYLRILLVGIFFAIAIGMAFVGRRTNSLIGFLVSVALSLVVYGAVLAFQSRYSERERDKLITSRRLPDFIRVNPIRFHRYVRATTREQVERINGKNTSKY